MRAPYLTGEMIYLRAFTTEDKDRATAWFPSPFPVDPPKAEEWLKDTHKNPWARVKHYAVCRNDSDEVVGSARVWMSFPHASVSFSMAPSLPDADHLRADAVRVTTRWLRDEGEHLVVTVTLAADEAESIAAAEAVGCVEAARLRQHVARPGHRVDKLYYQALNRRWRIAPAEAVGNGTEVRDA